MRFKLLQSSDILWAPSTGGESPLTVRYGRWAVTLQPLGPSTRSLCHKLWLVEVVRSVLGSPFGGAGTALAVTERALSAPHRGGTSPMGRGKAPSAQTPLQIPIFRAATLR